MLSKSRNSNTSLTDLNDHESVAVRWVAALVVGALAAIYLGWFLSYPVLAGMLGADGEPMSRLLFLTRVMLPEMWWSEMTGGGRLPLGFGDRWLIILFVASWLWWGSILGKPLIGVAFQNDVRIEGEEQPSLSLTWVESISLSMLVGLAYLSTATLLIGLAGGSRSLTIIYVVGVMIAIIGRFGVRRSHARVRWLPNDAAPTGVFGQLASRLVIVLTIVLALIYGLGVMMPPFEFDVVEYHLQSAKEFYQLGYVGFNDHNIYANMPLGLEMHSLASMSIVGESSAEEPWWLGGLMGKAIIGVHSLIGALLLGGFVARKTDSRWIGWGAAGLWLSVPGNAHVAHSGLIDAALGTYILASLVVVTELWQRLRNGAAEADMRSLRWLVLLCFVYSGFAAAAKYPGLIYAVLPCFAAVITAIRLVPKASRFSVAKQWVLPMLVGLSVTCVPWYAKNTVLAGNPVYPLAYSVFGGKGLDSARAEQWAKAHRVPGYSASAFINSAKQVFVASDGTQPVVLFLAVCGLLGPMVVGRGRASPPVPSQWTWPMGWLVGSMWIFLVWWLATHRIDRFWLPAVPISAAVAGSGVAWLTTRVSHGLATGLVLFGLLYGVVINASPAMGDNRFFVSLEGLRSDGGDAENVGRLSAPIAWCNENLPLEDTKLLLVGEARVFDFRMPIVYSTCFDVSPVETWLRGKTVDQQRAELAANGATHLLINWTEIARYRSPGNYGFSDWPSRDDIKKLTESGVVRPIEWPFATDSTELFEIVGPVGP